MPNWSQCLQKKASSKQSRIDVLTVLINGAPIPLVRLVMSAAQDFSTLSTMLNGFFEICESGPARKEPLAFEIAKQIVR